MGRLTFPTFDRELIVYFYDYWTERTVTLVRIVEPETVFIISSLVVTFPHCRTERLFVLEVCNEVEGRFPIFDHFFVEGER